MEKIARQVFQQKLDSLELPTIKSLDSSSNLIDVISFLQKNRIGSVTFTKNENLVGILTERDLLNKMPSSGIHQNEIALDKIMTPNPIALKISQTIEEAMQIMVFKEFRHIPILSEEGKIIKMISVKDILSMVIESFPESVKSLGTTTFLEILVNDAHTDTFSNDLMDIDSEHINASLFHLPLSKAIEKDVLSMDMNSPVDDVLERMQKEGHSAAVLTSFETKVMGIITERDFLYKIFGKNILGTGQKVSQFMTPKPHCLLGRHKVAYAVNNMFHYNYRRVIIVDEEGIPLALVDLLDILKFITRHLFELERE